MTDLEFLYEMRRKATNAGYYVFFTQEEVARMRDIYPYLQCYSWTYLYSKDVYHTTPKTAHVFLDAAIADEEERITKQVVERLEKAL